MRKFIYLFLIIISSTLFSCEKFLEPKPDNVLTEDQVLFNPVYAEGLLMKAYVALPDEYTFETDVASDDAVSNDQISPFRRMATGEWTSTNDPLTQWTYSYEQIAYINKFLDLYEKVTWSNSPNLTAAKNDLRNTLNKKRLKGEAFALRAWYKWRLLQYHGGIGSDNRLLGFPIIDKSLEPSDNWKIQRNTYAECVANIFADLDMAIANLPKTWVDGADADVNATSGARFLNRINGNTAMALKSRVALLAASPSFAAASNVTWANAATIAGPLLKDLGALYANGRVFYKEKSNKEILWNRSEVQKRTWEQENFPPSLFGNGRTNPSQNLVDAFGMKNGYPISNIASLYVPTNPYANRDPRLADYIIYNAAILKTVPINTYIDAPSNGINFMLTSTRTGYYLKKLLSESVKLDPGSSVNAGHTYTLARMTEVLLNYAEAANEAWGPTGDPNGYGFTAKSLIGDLRKRGGITPDDYLLSITDAAGLRALIRNERRGEL